MNTKLVTSQKLSKKLAEAGFKVESEFYWRGDILIHKTYKESHSCIEWIPAYLSGELGEVLPYKIMRGKQGFWLEIIKDGDGWDVNYKWRDGFDVEELLRPFSEDDVRSTEVEAMGEMVLYLKEKGLM